MATTPNTPMILPVVAQQGLIEFHKQATAMQAMRWNMRDRMQEIDRVYMREKNWTINQQRAKLANRLGDASKIQDVTIPIVMPQVEALVTYLSSVFLTGDPIFGAVANPLYMDAALQLETVLSENSTRGGWVGQIMMAMRDAAKYNIAGIETVWDRKTSFSIETDTKFSPKLGKPVETVWEGNCLKRIDMYNSIIDTRVHPSMVAERGEFAGYVELMSRIALKTFLATLPAENTMNFKAAFESGYGGSDGVSGSYFIPQLNQDALVDMSTKYQFDWMQWAALSGAQNNGIQYKNIYEITTLYVRIIPSDFSLRVPGLNTPQVWKLIIVNNQVIVFAERQTNAHDRIPINYFQLLHDGLGYQTKSHASNAQPFQEVSSALMNGNIATRRRAISDRALYDPSRVNEKDINNPSPTAKIPVRPNAYGKPLAEAVYPFPFRDDQSATIMQDIQSVMKFGDMATGQNQAQQGQFVKGNKTRDEFNDVMDNANGRNQCIALMLECQLFTPIKEILKINVLQYQGAASIYNKSLETTVTIDPVVLRKAVLEFKVSDGILPSSKIISGEDLGSALQALQQSPQLGAGYNVAPLFSYLMKTRHVDLRPFEKSQPQVAYEAAMAQWKDLVLTAMKQNPQITQQQLPPQPTPDQYGYTPGQAAQEPEKPTSIIEQVAAAQGAQSAPAGAPQPAQGATNATPST